MKYQSNEEQHKQDMKVKDEQLKEKDREMEEMKQQYERKLDRKDGELNEVTRRSFNDRKAANVVSLQCVSCAVHLINLSHIMCMLDY